MADKVAATWHPAPGPFGDWQEAADELLATAATPDEAHRPVFEEGLPGQSGWICADDNEPWPCTHEQDRTREEPDRG